MQKNNIYKRLIENCNKEILSIDSYLKEIGKIINEDKIENKPFTIINEEE